jgi:predicted methyltransferase
MPIMSLELVHDHLDWSGRLEATRDPESSARGTVRYGAERERFFFCVILILATVLPVSGIVMASDLPSASVAAAVADPSRLAIDTVRDANRKPAIMLAFSGVKPGDKVADYAAGVGYFTRLFATIVGPDGHVYASVPSPLFQYPNIVKGISEIQHYAVGHPNVSVNFASAIDAARYPEKLDLFWISQNYHDLKDPFMGPVDMGAFNRAVYAALKPGGIYIVLDHVAAPGSPDPNDPHTAGPFDASIQGKTDQFIFKFRKP